MITLFSIPKPFKGHIGVIQRNAIQSWARLDPSAEILLLGREEGLEQAAQDCGARWIPELKRNELGTPLLDDAFAQSAQAARHDWICYVNTDIILPRDFSRLIQAAPSAKTLFAGQRWDLDLAEAVDYSLPDWEARLREAVSKRGALHPPSGSDYFLFRKDSGLAQLPPFAVGRPGWDNWFIFRARQLGLKVVDATASAQIIHQNHDYRHVPARSGAEWEGREANANRALMGGSERCFTLLDATHVMAGGVARPARDRSHLLRRIKAFAALHPYAGWPLRAAQAVRGSVRALLPRREALR